MIDWSLLKKSDLVFAEKASHSHYVASQWQKFLTPNSNINILYSIGKKGSQVLNMILFSWWFQILLYAATFAMFVLVMEFFRFFPMLNLYLSIAAFVILFPIQLGIVPGFYGGDVGDTIEFLFISPLLTLLCAWRLSYIPFLAPISNNNSNSANNNTNNNTYNLYNRLKMNTIKMSKKLFNKGFCQRNNTDSMEMLWFSFIFMYIIFRCNFWNGYIFNPICGLLLAFTFPFPSRIVKINHFKSFYVCNKYIENVYDGISDGLTVFWILGFTLWDLNYLFSVTPYSILIRSFHVVPNCVRCIYTKQYDLWTQLMIFTLGISIFMIAPMRNITNPIIDWYLNTQESLGIVIVLSKSRVIVEIWGLINVIVVSVHVYVWIKELKRRKSISNENANKEQMTIRNYIQTQDNDMDVDAYAKTIDSTI